MTITRSPLLHSAVLAAVFMTASAADLSAAAPLRLSTVSGPAEPVRQTLTSQISGQISSSGSWDRSSGGSIPLAEHPRPDFKRDSWINLNGCWKFAFDPENTGEQESWFLRPGLFDREIVVPFSWGAPLSGVPDEADVGWYLRTLTIPDEWSGKRVFVIIGASDWRTTAWLDGNRLGSFRGGYTPFEFELTPYVKTGSAQQLVLRVDDTPHPFKLEGKQGYGRAAGIWQTVYLEARPAIAIKSVRFYPDIDRSRVQIRLELDRPAPEAMNLELVFRPEAGIPVERHRIASGAKLANLELGIDHPRLWTLDDPFLYEVDLRLGEGSESDRVSTYFGMRKISVVSLPGSDIPYIALNNEPVYLQMTLDQAHHPEGYYTFPSDDFMRDEILRTRRLGLNGQRIHVKIGIPRKLYWADRLGILIMADVPNSWGIPDAEMRRESETALRAMIERDFNHPSIFAWVLFNETWGLRHDREYRPETREWVRGLVHETRNMDPTRLVEDNSANRRDHVETDINSWHAYLPGYAWGDRLKEISDNTYPGSPWNFIDGLSQSGQPNFNSECGNVWGYQGSTGDVDWSWDYHIMVNQFRRYPKICGWLYTEHHDVINEWNGYYRYDRSEKETGLASLFPGMSLRDLHNPFYVCSAGPLCSPAEPGERVKVPCLVSLMTDRLDGRDLRLEIELCGWDRFGRSWSEPGPSVSVTAKAWSTLELPPLSVSMPEQPGLAMLRMVLRDPAGVPLMRNFTLFVIGAHPSPRDEIVAGAGATLRALRWDPDDFSESSWSVKQWSVLGGVKVNGAGAGYFEYRRRWPADIKTGEIESAAVLIEVSSKQIFGKDRDQEQDLEGDYMRGRGAHDPGLNPNAYPMSDENRYPGAFTLYLNNRSLGQFDLRDDAADHRGILSWYSQKKDRRLHEAGSYGELIRAAVPHSLLEAAEESGELRLRLQVSDALANGLAVYGERFGRYPVDPTLLMRLK